MGERPAGAATPQPDVAVAFAPAGRRGRVPVGTTVLDAARLMGVDLDSVCGGRGLCGRCQVSIGERPGVPADDGRLSAPGAVERSYRGRRPLEAGRRLGCAAQILDDVVIDVPADSQVRRQVVRKDAPARTLPVDPVVRLHYLEVPGAALADGMGDVERVRIALHRQWGLSDLAVDLTAVAALRDALADAGALAGVTVAVRAERDLVAAWPGLRDAVYGIAFDVGSTTLAGHLCALGSGRMLASAGCMNPQIAVGDDLMSRVSYVQRHPEGRRRLTRTVRRALAALAAELCAQAGVEPAEVLEVTLVGNPIMHHLVLGLDPSALGSAPFALATAEAVTVRADDLGLGVHPGARVYVPPCIAGHVGADAAAMVLAEAPHRDPHLTLLVDIGTNAEVVLGNDRRVLAASSPTGPAFEGAQISAGQRAAEGAIERVRIDRATLEPRVRVIGVEPGSEDPGFEEETRATAVSGICGSGIIEAVAELFLSGVVTSDGRIVRPRDTDRVVERGRTLAYRLWDDPIVEITQEDVRAVQLAKAALQAGCRLLMDRFGVTTVDRIRIAGAFGSHIDPTAALVLGLLPDCDPDRVESVGNAAGIGAMMTLLSAAARRDIEAVTARIEKIETAIEPDFQRHFVAAMAFPHATLPYPGLGDRVPLPMPATRARRGRRRRVEQVADA